MDIETDKATMGWEAQEEGIVAAVLVQEGDQEVPVGQVVLVMVDDAADIPAFSDYTASAAAAPAAPAAAPAAAATAAPAVAGAMPAAGPGAAPVGGGAPKVGSGSKVLASPLARALAREAGVDLSAATPTGPHGYGAQACMHFAGYGGSRLTPGVCWRGIWHPVAGILFVCQNATRPLRRTLLTAVSLLNFAPAGA